MIDAVVDIGNTRAKYCRAVDGKLVLPVYGIAGDEPADRDKVIVSMGLKPGIRWGVGSTHPERLDRFRDWATSRGDTLVVIDSPQKVPVAIDVDFPGKVGIDRLLNALASRKYLTADEPAVIVDAGSAVTVDLIDDAGTFLGGTIFPGLRLMALSLHEHTAKLPLVDVGPTNDPAPPGKNTEQAMRLGILHAVAGGIDSITRELATRCTIAPKVLLTGGDMTPKLAQLLQIRHQFESHLRSTLTLEGLLRAAEAQS